MKIKKVFIISIVFLIMFITVSISFASNLTDKHVYGLFTENFNGATRASGTVDDNIKFNAWGESGDSVPTATIVADSTAKEGNQYYSCTAIGGGGRSGFCYTASTGISNSSTTVDISAFSTLEFYIKPKTGDVSNIKVGITDSNGVTDNNRTVTLNSLGITNSTSTWQKCSLDLSTLTSADLTKVKNVFLFDTTNQTATFDLDGIVLKRSTPGTFDITIKNISDNTETTSVTWNVSAFRQNWVVAEQYVELNLDISGDAWSIKVYTDNGAKNKNGLIDTTDGTRILPMCWRVNDFLLPVTSPNKKTLTIAESSFKGNLYDGGVVLVDPDDTGYWCWFRMTDVKDITAGDYAIVWDSKGFHAAENADEFYGMSGEIYPKVYLGAKFSDALGGLIYSTDVKFVLTYE